MGIQINGNTDNISATDGGLTVSDLELNQTGVSTFHSHLHVADQIIHLDDANSKIRFPAADTITAETAGTERLRIDSAGRVLIGTTSSAYKFCVADNTNASLVSQLVNTNTGSSTKSIFQIQTGSNRYVNFENDYTGQYIHVVGSGITTYFSSFDTHSFRNNAGTERLRITATGDFNTYHDTNDEGMFVRNTANNAAIRIYASGGSPSGAFRIAHNGPTDSLQIDRTNTSGAYSDTVLGFYSNRTWKRAPIGTIINVGYARHDPDSDSYSAIASNTRASSAAYLDFTPIRSDSKLIIMTRMHTRIIAANGCSYGIEVSTNSGSSYTDVDGMIQRNAMDFFYKSDAVNLSLIHI